MKSITKIIAALAAVLLLYGLVTVGVNAIFNRTAWLYREYSDKLDIERFSGISAEDATRVLSRMMYYSIGRADDLDITIEEDGVEVSFFNESELSHMRDVRRLAKTILWTGGISLIISIGVVCALLMLKKHDALRTFSKAYLIALCVAAVIIIALAVWVAVDFDGFWVTFHIVFLDLESSTFDPATSRMIRICPAELFADFTGRLGGYVAALTGAVGIACALHLHLIKKQNRLRK